MAFGDDSLDSDVVPAHQFDELLCAESSGQGFEQVAHNSAAIDPGESINDYARIFWPNQSRYFMAVAQEYERGPELDREGAPKPTAAPIGNPDMAHARMSREGGRNKRLGRTAVAACRATELQHRGAGQLVYLGAVGFAGCILVVDCHVIGGLLKCVLECTIPKS